MANGKWKMGVDITAHPRFIGVHPRLFPQQPFLRREESCCDVTFGLPDEALLFLDQFFLDGKLADVQRQPFAEGERGAVLAVMAGDHPLQASDCGGSERQSELGLRRRLHRRSSL
jgi:hypothetical protein